jgi:hypothetical protein
MPTQCSALVSCNCMAQNVTAAMRREHRSCVGKTHVMCQGVRGRLVITQGRIGDPRARMVIVFR